MRLPGACYHRGRLSPLVLVTGFGPFLDVTHNPSGEVARALALAPPAGMEIAAGVLPVSFAGAPAGLEALLDGLRPRIPDALLGLGLHRGSWLRLELRARAAMTSPKRDSEGRSGAELGPLPGGELRSGLDLAVLAEDLRAAGADDVRLSDDAGGYVCERTYRATLEAGARLARPALFLHVPSAEHLSIERQAELLRAWIPSILRRARALA